MVFLGLHNWCIEGYRIKKWKIGVLGISKKSVQLIPDYCNSKMTKNN